MKETAPIFVKIEEYKDALETVNAIKLKLTEARDILTELSALKAEEDSEIESWKAEMEDVEKRMSYIDSTLFEE
ncbi:MAG: hypothetical protein Q8O89_03715 [Nanoarchaeota archaeon]|nr:hypothetical protein [Nanoarchaeota archaeon]